MKVTAMRQIDSELMAASDLGDIEAIKKTTRRRRGYSC